MDKEEVRNSFESNKNWIDSNRILNRNRSESNFEDAIWKLYHMHVDGREFGRSIKYLDYKTHFWVLAIKGVLLSANDPESWKYDMDNFQVPQQYGQGQLMRLNGHTISWKGVNSSEATLKA